MKYIITESQYNDLLNPNNDYVKRIILRNYDMDISSSVSKHRTNYIIKIGIKFTPKEENNMFPKTVTSKAEFSYDPKNDTSEFEDMIYIRKEEMPILNFINNDYYLDDFLTKIVTQVAKDEILKIKSNS
jgi:hypothetical protein